MATRSVLSERSKDRIAAAMIRVGGGAVIVLVAAMVVGIAMGALPLFSGADLGPPSVSELAGEAIAVGWQSRSEHAWYLDADGNVIGGDGTTLCRVDGFEPPISRAAENSGRVTAFLDASAAAHIGVVRFVDRWRNGSRSSTAEWLSLSGPLALDPLIPWSGLTANTNDEGDVVAVAWSAERLLVARWLASLEQWQEIRSPPLTGVRAAAVADGLETAGLIAADGSPVMLRLRDASVEGFTGAAPPFNRARFLVGGGSLVATTAEGEVAVVQRQRRVVVANRTSGDLRVGNTVIPAGESREVADDNVGQRFAHRQDVTVNTAEAVWHIVRRLPSLGAEPTCIAPAVGDRSFMVGGADGSVALYHATSGEQRLRTRWPIAPLTALAIADRGDSVVGLAPRQLAAAALSNPHPEISLKTLFLPVRYEGYAAPRLLWQTSGGSDAFERKLSVTPLIFGTLKATLYAMVVSVPLALLAAVYVSQLAPSWLQTIVKPTVELMAAVPSVVVGLLAALWLAPRFETMLFRSFLVAAALPLVVLAALGAWRLLPAACRRRAPSGVELGLLTVAGAAVFGGVSLIADPIELWLFDGDLTRWLFTEWGIRYDQRNALVVGIALGFAVIPVIFTIAEDACSSVPRSLTQAARSLGATRWQAAVRMVVPAASPGLFAAVILGFGRAVGETMIVLMVSGNTPLLDLDPFSGMRTMAATIAVEIPEAALDGTLYRVLFLTGLLLFAFTFTITAAADVIVRALRRRYARF